jgi:cytoskeletal protein CcmA (bactofilin family)
MTAAGGLPGGEPTKLALSRRNAMFSKSAKTSTAADLKLHPKTVSPSVISADMKIVGSVESQGDLQVDGTIEGDVNSRSAAISESAIVRGSITADSVRVSGRVKGGLTAKSVILAASAKVEGDIVHQSISIETGATFEGQCRRMPTIEKAEPAKSEPVKIPLLVGSAAAE